MTTEQDKADALEWVTKKEGNLRQCMSGREYSEADFLQLRALLTLKALCKPSPVAPIEQVEGLAEAIEELENFIDCEQMRIVMEAARKYHSVTQPNNKG